MGPNTLTTLFSVIRKYHLCFCEISVERLFSPKITELEIICIDFVWKKSLK